MDSSYGRFAKLLAEKEITPYRVHKDTGIATATLSDWKNGKSIPKQDKMLKIANYLKVSLEYLTTGRERTAADGSLLAEFGFYHMDFIENFNKLSDEDVKYIKYITKRLAEK